jgi:hypothetical protein
MLSTALAAMLAIAACDRSQATAIDPTWGKEPCAHCSMLVGDKSTAAELVTSSGERLFFDDVGCMVSWRSEHENEAAHAWVHDGAGDRWIDAAGTKYRAGAKTPMDYGFVASNDGVTYEDMRTEVLAKARVGR